MNRARDSAAAPASSTANLVALRRWLIALCTIRFDLERGQIIEDSFPSDALSADAQLHIAFSSFPDSMSQHHHPPAPRRSSIHDSIFSFRLPSSSSPSSFLYGFVFNRRRQDDRLPRGGDQRSVVIVSHSPFSSVFRPVLQILAPLYFDIGATALSLVASHVSSWPAPLLGRPMELPIGNAALKVLLPPSPDDPSPSHGLFHDSDLFASFRGLLLNLWMLWELLIIGEPILLVAPSPPQCSEAVAALVSLVSPLLYSVDFRPYFTIHDPDFARLNALPEGAEFPPMLLGVTNLFFLKALKNIPHVISVGIPSPGPAKVVPSPPRSASTGNVRSSGPGRLNLEQLNKFSPLSLLNAMKLRREGPLCLMNEHKEAVWSSYAATTKPDTAVLNRLVDAGMTPRVEESMSVVNNEILRRHFMELTSNFLAPFGPYLRPTTPSEGSSPFVNPPPLPPFDAEEFLRGLAARGPGKFLSKRMRSNWLDLYRRFLKGKNFMPWFQRRRAAAEQEQQRLWRQARMNTEIQKLISKMSELEIVDSFNAIERHLLVEIQLHQSGNGGVDSAKACQKLKGDLQAVFNVLPKDTQQLLLVNPKRASLFQSNPELRKHPGHPSESTLSILPL
ncbi:protein DENND6A [Dioscorea cayenensis subsp. rotundata]|uniref:Protein DENND6A n=1 Tax=Dioscorea cayennensis subsp. rotundata TaxID=55577 RepID=A0AB40AHR1_DIOCR|nr:protein DENND6A [Dioscorea cayenensis subsp. rotundata]